LVGTERASHGDVATSFEYIAEMWTAHINAAMLRRTGIQTLPPVHLDARDVLLMMGDVKRARAIFGDETNSDNYIDNAGYTALAGMLMYVEPADRPQTMPEPDAQAEAAITPAASPQHDPAAEVVNDPTGAAAIAAKLSPSTGA
jgi:hypothetical protein